MTVIKCKICGGDIELSEDRTIGTCMYCGSTTTLPKIEDDQRAAMFNRGNHFRRIGEYDKALATYERIVAEDNTDAEAHWCCALSRFGIEYVEDPATYEWIPTCHRLSFDSFLEDVDYLAAVEFSDGITRRQYQKDGAKIAEVQRGILSVSQKEKPFDVFICYKESDENNNRTIDSTLAQDIYYQLTDKGYKVFFSRITLEDKVGTEYEPYIFAALNSAKVMIVVGTKPEYLNAVWVKNEWSRFLSLMKKDRSKVIIPCYRDMDPYDLPEQLSVLQSYDMAKIGFVQDLLRGISKIVSKEEKKPEVKTVAVTQSGPNVTSLLDRGNMALEDGEWASAKKYFDDVLNINSRCAEAYLGFTMIDVKVQNLSALEEFIIKNNIQNRNFERARQFADESLKMKIDQWFIKRQVLLDQKEKIYAEAIKIIESTSDLEQLKKAEKEFESIIDYKDSLDKLKSLKEKIYTIEKENNRLENEYQKACQLMENPFIGNVRVAAARFKMLQEYKDAAQKRLECLAKAEKLEKEEEKQREEEEKQRKEKEKEKISKDYDRLVNVYESNDSNQLRVAAAAFGMMGDYKDAAQKRLEYLEKAEKLEEEEEKQKNEKEYNRLVNSLESNNPNQLRATAAAFKKMGDYRDAALKGTQCLEKAEILETKEKEYKSIINQIDVKNDELSKLGLFRGKEKAAIRVEIEKLTKRREQLKKELYL